jgi:hypothetical protein
MHKTPNPLRPLLDHIDGPKIILNNERGMKSPEGGPSLAQHSARERQYMLKAKSTTKAVIHTGNNESRNAKDYLVKTTTLNTMDDEPLMN